MITFSLPSAAQREFMRHTRSLSGGGAVSSGTMISVLRPREVSFDATRAAMSRLNAYSRKRPSGLRLPGVSGNAPSDDHGSGRLTRRGKSCSNCLMKPSKASNLRFRRRISLEINPSNTFSFIRW